jgi:hypothetical protein
MNPLKTIKINHWENQLISDLLGSQWQDKLWEEITTAAEKFIANQATPTVAAVQSWLQDHLTTYINMIDGGNPFVTAMLKNLLGGVLSKLSDGLMAWAAAKIASLAAVKPPVTAAPTAAQAPPTPSPTLQGTQGQTQPT